MVGSHIKIDKLGHFTYQKYFIPLFVKICYVQTGKKTRPNHFIGAASSNKVKASINNLLFALEIHLCDFKLLLAEFNKCKGVLIAFLHFTFSWSSLSQSKMNYTLMLILFNKFSSTFIHSLHNKFSVVSEKHNVKN